MTGEIYGWMRGLAFFFIFMTAVLNCLPDQKYRRYVRFFLGMLLLVLMARPLLSLFHLDEILSRSVSRGMLEARAEEAGWQVRAEGIQQELLYQGYQAEIESQIRGFLEERGIGEASVEVELNQEQMEVEAVKIRAVPDTEGILYQSEVREREEALAGKLEEVKTELSEVYGVDPAHIDVTVQK